MGGDLIPSVDNVNTFDTILQVISNNYIPNDSTRISWGGDHVVGGISDDPLFGTTNSKMFFELKPPSYPFLFEHPDSTKFFDSAVLVLAYQGYYGDTSSPLNYQLYQIGEKMKIDLEVKPNYNLQPGLSTNTSILWGQKTMQARQFKDTVYIKRGDSVYRKVTNQLRIPLNQIRAKLLFEADTNTVYKNDSLFKETLPGFVLQVQGSPGALHYFNLANGSRIEFYYRAKRGAIIDTTSANFSFTNLSGHAVEFNRVRNGAEVTNFLNQDPVNGVEQVYIQGNPGTMVSLKIPAIKTLTNRVLHRVELRVTELAENTGPYAQLSAPRALYLDGESENEPGNFKGIPYDLNPLSRYYCYPASGIDFNYFGGVPSKVDVGGSKLTQYTFNITRYVQSVITRAEPQYNLRLSAPYYFEYKDCSSSASQYPINVFPFQSGGIFINQVGESRFRAAGGNHPDPRIRMQVRVIYSKY